jgi:hypothetical protein
MREDPRIELSPWELLRHTAGVAGYIPIPWELDQMRALRSKGLVLDLQGVWHITDAGKRTLELLGLRSIE